MTSVLKEVFKKESNKERNKNMTKTFKRIISVIVATVMVMMLGINAFAAAPYDITITRSAADKSTHTYTAYQIFAGTLQPDDTLTDIDWGTAIADGDAFIAALQAANTAFNTCATASDVAALLDSDNTLADVFAKTAAANVTTPAGSVISTAGNESATIEISTTAGYYLITDAITGNNENSSVSRLMLKVDTTHTTGGFDAKSVVPSITKAIDDGTEAGLPANTASIGDTIPFVLRTEVPNDMTGYTKYFFVVKDTLSKGLTFDDTSVEITLDGTTYDSSKYTVEATTDSTTGVTSLKIVFKDFISLHDAAVPANDYCGKPIVIKYNATLNEKADRTDAGNPNTVYLEYSNNPNVTPTGDNEPSATDPVGKTPESKTVTYTTGVKVIKVDNNNNKLPGAVFSISGLGGTKVVTVKGEYVRDDSLTDPSKIYYKLTDGTYTQTAPTSTTAGKYADNFLYKYTVKEEVETVSGGAVNSITVDADGYIVFSGLGDGTYTITEDSAPSGYVKSDETITFTISSAPTLTAPNWKIKVGTATTASEAPFTDAEKTIIQEFTVVNPKKSNLPETGGIGTTIFYVAGSILVLSGAALLITKKKMEASEK